MGESGAMEWSAGVVELARVAATSPVVANYPSRRLVRRNLAIGPELRVWLYRKAQSPSLTTSWRLRLLEGNASSSAQVFRW